MINRARRSALRHYANGFYSTAPALLVYHKGQIILKWFLVSSISSKKQTKEIDFTTMIPQVDLFSFGF